MKRDNTQPAMGGAAKTAPGTSDCATPGPPLTGPAEARLPAVSELAWDKGAPVTAEDPPARSTNNQSSCLVFESSAPAAFSPAEASCGASATVRSNTTSCVPRGNWKMRLPLRPGSMRTLRTDLVCPRACTGILRARERSAVLCSQSDESIKSRESRSHQSASEDVRTCAAVPS